MKTRLLALAPILAFFLTTLSAQAAPPFVTYAGQVASGGQPYNGTGQFKFAFVNADANLTYWSQDGTSSAGSQPTGHVSTAVNGGYYSILLGNTAITGMAAIDPTIFKTHSDVHLRVWFSDGVAPFQEMTPHRPFASVPYALNAGVADGSITQSKLSTQVQALLSSQSSSIFAPTLANPYGYAGGTPIEHNAASYTVPSDKVLVILTSGEVGNVKIPSAGNDYIKGSSEGSGGTMIVPPNTVVEFYQAANGSWPTQSFSGLLFDPVSHLTPVVIPSGFQVPTGKVLVATCRYLTKDGAGVAGPHSDNPTIHLAGTIINGYGCGYLVDASMLASAGSGSGSSTPAPGSITKSMLAQEVLADLNASGSGATPGGIIAVPYGQNAPAGYSPYTLGDRKGFAWTEKTAVTQVRYPYDAVVAVGTDIYFVGGSAKGAFRGYSGSGSNVTTVEKYNLATNSWQAVAPLPAARFRYATATLNGKIHVLGGNGLNTSVVYDPSTNQWTAGPNLPSVVENGRSISYNGKIYLIGGEGAAGNQVLEFDPSTNQWSAKATMTTARSGVELVVFENRIWAIGSDQTQSNVAESFDPVGNSWRTETSLPNTADIAWVANGTIYCGVYGGEIFVFDSTNSLWRQSGAMPGYFDAYGYAISAAVVTGSRVHLVGGPSNGAGVGFGPANSNKHYVADLNSSVLGVRDLYVRNGNASTGPGSSTPAPGSITKSMLAQEVLNDLNATPSTGSVTKSMLSSEVLTDLNRTQSVVGTSDDAFTEGLRAYLRPMLAGGVWHSWGLSG
ncbi:MAG: hypothetical protein HN531_13895, partial [Opitutae bacterium]|nr:hypothetical protein [Opitutae bacterium]